MRDLVYYLKIANEILYELVFESVEAAIEYAEENAIKDYEVVEWDVA